MNKSIIITGGAGFIGSHVVRLFVNKYPEYKIINVDKLEKYYDKYINQEITDIDFRNKWPKNYICEDLLEGM